MKNKEMITLNILNIIYSSTNKKLDGYSIYTRIKIPFPDFMKNIISLRSRNLISGDTLTWSITDKGIKYVIDNYSFFSSRERIWRKVPEDMLGPKLEVDYKYVPSKRLLDKKFNIDIDNKNDVRNNEL